MGLFLANQTPKGADVQMSVADWYMVVDVLTRHIQTMPLGRAIQAQLLDHDHVGPMRVAMTNDQIEIIEGIVSRR